MWEISIWCLMTTNHVVCLWWVSWDIGRSRLLHWGSSSFLNCCIFVSLQKTVNGVIILNGKTLASLNPDTKCFGLYCKDGKHSAIYLCKQGPEKRTPTPSTYRPRTTIYIGTTAQRTFPTPTTHVALTVSSSTSKAIPTSDLEVSFPYTSSSSSSRVTDESVTMIRSSTSPTTTPLLSSSTTTATVLPRSPFNVKAKQSIYWNIVETTEKTESHSTQNTDWNKKRYNRNDKDVYKIKKLIFDG